MSNLSSAPRDLRRWLVRFPRTVPVVIFLLTSAVTALSVFAIERVEHEKLEAQLGQIAQSVASSLERRGNASATYLRAGSALFSTFKSVSASEFRQFVSQLRLDTDYRGADGIGWAQRVDPQQLKAFEDSAYQDFPGHIRVRPRSSPDRPYLIPVTFLEPETERNRRAIGFDMFSEEVRRAAMIEAERTARPTASGSVVLEQEGTGTAPGFLIYMPVFEDSGGGRRLRGFIYSPFNAQDFLASALQQENVDAVAIRLYDEGPAGNQLVAQLPLGETGGKVITRRIMVANHPWVLEVEAPGADALSSLSLATLLFGMLVASLLMVVVRLVTQQAKESQERISWYEEQNSIRTSLTRELNHRVKNTLANVLSIVAMTKRRATDMESFAEGIDGRIRALSATHDLLTQSDWGTTPIRAVIRAELAPYVHTGEDAVQLAGPDLELAPNDALSLGLALHELATNAAKYGALSHPQGKVRIAWRQLTDRLAKVEWVESGGPPVPVERRRGFGTDLVEKVVAHELGYPVDLRFDPDGVKCSLTIPLRQPSDFAIRARK